MSSGRYTYFVLHMAMHVFMCTHFRNVRRKCHTIRNFTFDLHTTTTQSERHVSVCLHALIVQMFCRIYCRILCRILFPHIARSHTFSKGEEESHVAQHLRRSLYISEDLCITTPGEQTHIPRRSLYNIPSRSLDKVEFTLQLPYHSA